MLSNRLESIESNHPFSRYLNLPIRKFIFYISGHGNSILSITTMYWDKNYAGILEP